MWKSLPAQLRGLKRRGAQLIVRLQLLKLWIEVKGLVDQRNEMEIYSAETGWHSTAECVKKDQLFPSPVFRQFPRFPQDLHKNGFDSSHYF